MTGRGWIIVLVALAGGCGGAKLIGDGPHPPEEPFPEGVLTYYVGKDVLVLRTTVTRTIVTELNEALKPVKTTDYDYAGEIEVRTVPDTAQVFALEMRPGAASMDSLTVQMRPGGMLQAVNVSSESKIADVIKNVGSLAGSVVGAVGALRGGPTNGVIEAIKDETGFKALAADLPDKDLQQAMQELPRVVVAMLRDWKRARALWLEIRSRQIWLDRYSQMRLTLLRGVDEEEEATVKLQERRLAALDKVIATVQRERGAGQAAFDALLAEYRREKNLEPKEETRELIRILELDELPEPDVIDKSLRDSSGPYSVRVKQALAKHEAAARLYDEAGVVVTLSPPPRGLLEEPEEEEETEAEADPAEGEEDEDEGADEPERGRVFFRQSYPARLGLWVQASLLDDKGVPKEQLVLVSNEIVHVLHPATRAEWLDFDPAAFAKRELKLTFDEKSRIVTLERTSTAALAESTEAFAKAATGFRDTLAETYKKAAEIEESRRKLELADLETELQRLQKQKALLDARLALEGATATQDLLLERKILDNQLAALQARINLEKTEATAELGVALAQLQAEVSVLKEQIQLLQKQLELAQTQGG
ncbi:MAG: coiled-coil domain-containing protein [Planctomycetota bacterium]|jgi:hypothetical protein